MNASNQGWRKLLLNKHGAVAVEYAMILTAVVVPAVTGIMYQGNKMYSQYIQTRDLIVLPIP